jgi:hypothetical protein
MVVLAPNFVANLTALVLEMWGRVSVIGFSDGGEGLLEKKLYLSVDGLEFGICFFHII